MRHWTWNAVLAGVLAGMGAELWALRRDLRVRERRSLPRRAGREDLLRMRAAARRRRRTQAEPEEKGETLSSEEEKEEEETVSAAMLEGFGNLMRYSAGMTGGRGTC